MLHFLHRAGARIGNGGIRVELIEHPHTCMAAHMANALLGICSGRYALVEHLAAPPGEACVCIQSAPGSSHIWYQEAMSVAETQKVVEAITSTQCTGGAPGLGVYYVRKAVRATKCAARHCRRVRCHEVMKRGQIMVSVQHGLVAGPHIKKWTGPRVVPLHVWNFCPSVQCLRSSPSCVDGRKLPTRPAHLHVLHGLFLRESEIGQLRAGGLDVTL